MSASGSNSQARLSRVSIALNSYLRIKYVPKFIKSILRYLYFLFLDLRYYISGGVDKMIPQPSLAGIGIGNYEAIGEEFFSYFKSLIDLKPRHHVLDVGCGFGRLSLPLTRYLSNEGSYTGFDIIKSEIDWAKEHISSKFSNFTFQHFKVLNNIYNTDGVNASGFTFPYENESFDFVFLNSVFTHMLPSDVENYMLEIRRVLKHDGKCLITFFLLNNYSNSQIQSDNSLMDFKYEMDGFSTIDINAPEEAIAYDEDVVKMYFDKCNLKIIEPIHYGSWCGGSKYLSFQDIIIATKHD